MGDKITFSVGARMTECTRCRNTGFLNYHQIDEDLGLVALSEEDVFAWIESHPDCDVQVCDCCGDGVNWYGIPGEHYNSDDPSGKRGPYAYNGGLCECH